MSIVTKGGDRGETSLLGGQRVPKTDPRIEAYGTVDELNAAIGVALAYVKNKNSGQILRKVQNNLFKVGAQLSAVGTGFTKHPRIASEDTEELEKVVYSIEKKLPRQTAFILPNGKEAAAHLHLARAICRRAERRVMTLRNHLEVHPEIIKYLNRLSDLLFICARLENKGKDEPVCYD